MWRLNCVGAFGLLFLSLPGYAVGPTLAEARQRWLRGNYEEARALYETLAKDAFGRSPKDITYAAAVIGVSRSLQSQGEYDKALDVIDAALKSNNSDADLLARR